MCKIFKYSFSLKIELKEIDNFFGTLFFGTLIVLRLLY